MKSPLQTVHLVAPEELGAVVRAAREREAMKVKELAEAIGVAPSVLSRAELGDSSYASVLVRAATFIGELRQRRAERPLRGVSEQTAYVMPDVFRDEINDLRMAGRLFRRELMRETLAPFGIVATFEPGRAHGSFEAGGDRFMIDVDEGMLYRTHADRLIVLDHVFARAHDPAEDRERAATFAQNLRADLALVKELGRDVAGEQTHYLWRRPLDA